ncbi:MAG: hypothetical protein OK452_04255 [Thaumarchaeota archaeon]|nr:hypothetical protein [Nitrososphaerota archaeon]
MPEAGSEREQERKDLLRRQFQRRFAELGITFVGLTIVFTLLFPNLGSWVILLAMIVGGSIETLRGVVTGVNISKLGEEYAESRKSNRPKRAKSDD